MDRRRFQTITVRFIALAPCAALLPARAIGIADISNVDASSGLKAALEQGANAAVGLLGRPDGFLANPKVRIPLPGFLNDAGKIMRPLGMGKQLDELETSMNRAAEAAVPLARSLLADAVRTLTLTDARKILTGGDTSVTGFFAEKTRAPLSERFLPVVSQAVAKVGLAEKYNKLARKASNFGMKSDDPSIQHHVTRKALDGLYLMIGEEEKKIRRDPVGTGSALLQKVFGAMK
jgi:hypothetical protein